MSRNVLSTTAEEIFPVNYGVKFREIVNMDPAIVIYVGFTNALTNANGHPVAGGGSFGLEDVAARRSIWAVSASGTPEVSLFEV